MEIYEISVSLKVPLKTILLCLFVFIIMLFIFPKTCHDILCSVILGRWLLAFLKQTNKQNPGRGRSPLRIILAPEAPEYYCFPAFYIKTLSVSMSLSPMTNFGIIYLFS